MIRATAPGTNSCATFEFRERSSPERVFSARSERRPGPRLAFDQYLALGRRSLVSKLPVLFGIEGKKVKITGRIELYKGKPEIRINP
jgi:hypothetical protein